MIYRAGPGGGGGGGGGGGPRNPPPPDPPAECPEVLTAALTDVARAGNGAFALTLQSGHSLSLVWDSTQYRVEAGGRPLGWILPNISKRLKRCIDELGYSYSATIRAVGGSAPAPKIEVAVER